MSRSNDFVELYFVVFYFVVVIITMTSQWRHNDCHGLSNHQHIDCLLSRLFRLTSKKASKLRVTSLCKGNPPVTSRFPTQRTSQAENISICWRLNEPLCITQTRGLYDIILQCAVYWGENVIRSGRLVIVIEQVSVKPEVKYSSVRVNVSNICQNIHY